MLFNQDDLFNKKADTNKDPAKVKKARKRLKYLNTALKVIKKLLNIYYINAMPTCSETHHKCCSVGLCEYIQA